MMEQGSEVAPELARTTAAKVAPPSWLGRVLLAAVLVVSLAGLLAYAAGRCPIETLCGPVVSVDLNQGRIDSQVPAPQGDFTVEQTFRAGRNGLREIELILIRYGGEQSSGELRVQLWDAAGVRVAEDVLASGRLAHNQTYLLRFPAQVASEGQTYRLRLVGDDQNHVSAWGYSLNDVPDGALALQPEPGAAATPVLEARSLRLVTRYELTARDGLAAAATGWVANAGLLLALLLLLFMPGVLLLVAVGPRKWAAGAWWGVALALGVAVWPIVWLWLGLTPWQWTGRWLWLVVGAGWGLAALLWWRARRQAPPPARPRTAVRWSSWLLLLLLLVTVSSRLLAVRDLSFPPWVDSSRHGLITAVMEEQGSWPADYEPFLPVERTPYHYGFHTLSTALSLMTGVPLPELLLYVGQFLNGLLPLTVYAAGWLLTRRHDVALLAAFLVALPFFFPGYYVTWGRLTQLSAMLVLPVALGLTWRLGRGWPHVWPFTGVLVAGLFLLHFRVFLFYLPFALLAGVIGLLLRRRWLGLAQAAVLSLLLVAPRLPQLWREANPAQALQATVPGFNDFPVGYYTAGWERYYVWLAGVALLVAVVALVRGRRWALLPLTLAGWVGLLFLLLAGAPLGLPETLIVNLNSMYISLFVPLALLLAIVVAQVAQWLVRLGRQTAVGRGALVLLALVAGVGLGALALFGFRQQVGIVNEQTILAETADLDALAWIAANLPEEALIAVNSWRWHGSTWAAGDGGAWIVPLTGRRTTTPPIDHIYNPDLFAQVRDFNEAASTRETWASPEAAAWLREQGVSHVYVGARGGFFDPAALMRNPAIVPLYDMNGTWVFAVNPTP